MQTHLPENAFEYFGLSPKSTQRDVVLASLKLLQNKAIMEDKTKIAEIASYQKLLLDPGSRFLIELLYYFDTEKLREDVNR